MVRFLWQVEDLLARVRWGKSVLPLPCLNWIIILAIIVGIKKLLKPLDEVKVVLKSSFYKLLNRNDLSDKKRKKMLDKTPFQHK